MVIFVLVLPGGRIVIHQLAEQQDEEPTGGGGVTCHERGETCERFSVPQVPEPRLTAGANRDTINL